MRIFGLPTRTPILQTSVTQIVFDSPTLLVNSVQDLKTLDRSKVTDDMLHRHTTHRLDR